MDKNKLFEILGLSADKENLSKNENKNENEIPTEYNIGFIRIKMFTKMIEGISEFKKNIKRKNGFESTYSYDELANSVIFNRSISFIETISAQDLQFIPELDYNNAQKFKKALQVTIKYYEQLEEYELCAFLFSLEKALTELKN